ncbi:hypothetical protein OOZ51_03335 [Arthrobacter sp. MI7-26]|uniref:hypothetical protein n=1 Tax=Arthrobacter sp. MI7-26 TaxID=2993653 RepID=UPI002248E15E|nr:hypothetical protein [Arthrobacter sp. MI7-26]MCX2746845.1 hypothetical protein [Arthrobacter sp. MI7-26]
MLSHESAGTQQVVETAAAMIGAPVVVEDLQHLVLAYSARRLAPTELLDDWERRSRTLLRRRRPMARPSGSVPRNR